MREATDNGEGPLNSVPELMRHAEELRRYLGMSKFQKALAKLRVKFSKVFTALKD